MYINEFSCLYGFITHLATNDAASGREKLIITWAGVSHGKVDVKKLGRFIFWAFYFVLIVLSGCAAY